MILGPESAPLSKLYWSVMMENENDSGRRISLIILVVGIQKFAAGWGGIGNKAQLRPAKAGAGAWPELGKNRELEN